MQISIKAVELVDNARKKVLIQRAKEVKSMIYNSNLSLDGIISKGYYLYEKKYKESLSIRELTILSLYMIFPNDDKFMNMLYNYNYDFNKVAKLYSVNCTVVRLRYDCYMSLKNTKILELK